MVFPPCRLAVVPAVGPITESGPFLPHGTMPVNKNPALATGCIVVPAASADTGAAMNWYNWFRSRPRGPLLSRHRPVGSRKPNGTGPAHSLSRGGAAEEFFSRRRKAVPHATGDQRADPR